MFAGAAIFIAATAVSAYFYLLARTMQPSNHLLCRTNVGTKLRNCLIKRWPSRQTNGLVTFSMPVAEMTQSDPLTLLFRITASFLWRHVC